MFLQLQVFPAVSCLLPYLLHLRRPHVTAVFHQLLDGERRTVNFCVVVLLIACQTQA